MRSSPVERRLILRFGLVVNGCALAGRGAGPAFRLLIEVAPPVSGCAPVHPVEPRFCGEVPSPPDAFCADAARDDTSKIAVKPDRVESASNLADGINMDRA